MFRINITRLCKSSSRRSRRPISAGILGTAVDRTAATSCSSRSRSICEVAVYPSNRESRHTCYICDNIYPSARSKNATSGAVRTFASGNKKNKNKNKNKGGAKDGRLRINIVWDDLEDVQGMGLKELKRASQHMDDDDVPPFKGKTLEHFQEYLMDQYYLESSDLRLYDSQSKEFVPLESLEQVHEERQRTGGDVFILPQMDEEDSDYEYDPAEDDYHPEDDEDYDVLGAAGMQTIILDTVAEVKEQGWSPQQQLSADIPTMSNSKTHEIKSTREIILERAASDVSLQETLLKHVGALPHMVECLHYDFLWTWKDKERENDGNDNDD